MGVEDLCMDCDFEPGLAHCRRQKQRTKVLPVHRWTVPMAWVLRAHGSATSCETIYNRRFCMLLGGRPIPLSGYMQIQFPNRSPAFAKAIRYR